METTINPEYQKLIDKIDEVLHGESKYPLDPHFTNKLCEVIYGLRMLGTRPVISEPHQRGLEVINKISKSCFTDITKYADHTFNSLNKFGFVSSLVRLDECVFQLSNLENFTGLINVEIVKDRLMKIANHAVIALVWLDINKPKTKA